jgi:hypothetical protein
MGNLYKSGQLLETRITLEIEDGEAASSIAKVHAKEAKHNCRCLHEARSCVVPTTPSGVCARYPYRQVDEEAPRFNPLAFQCPPAPSPLQDIPVGGRGIHLLK